MKPFLETSVELRVSEKLLFGLRWGKLDLFRDKQQPLRIQSEVVLHSVSFVGKWLFCVESDLKLCFKVLCRGPETCKRDKQCFWTVLYPTVRMMCPNVQWSDNAVPNCLMVRQYYAINFEQIWLGKCVPSDSFETSWLLGLCQRVWLTQIKGKGQVFHLLILVQRQLGSSWSHW